MLYVSGVLIVFYLYCIVPRIIHRPDYSKLKGCRFAHRGLHNKKVVVPENSMPAFERAVELGYGIELDIQLTRDNKVVVFHDFDLRRMCGVDKRVCDLTFKELQKYLLLDSEQTIPLFSDVLKLVNGKVPLLVELKSKSWKDLIAPYANDILKEYKGEYFIQCFHPLTLRWYKKHRPDVIRGQLAESYHRQKTIIREIGSFLQQHLIFNFVCRPDFVSYNWRHQKELSLNVCHKVFHCPTAAWTVRSKEQKAKAEKRFDVIIFENFYI
ncbi:glycerophosphodiester phosphodiesterase family protein [[Clostridium] polysaccharolyticum]|nr:glycerophosphodiester phosphodiesterase family protein [[Clostridium] polysaccharolyticum]